MRLGMIALEGELGWPLL